MPPQTAVNKQWHYIEVWVYLHILVTAHALLPTPFPTGEHTAAPCGLRLLELTARNNVPWKTRNILWCSRELPGKKKVLGTKYSWVKNKVGTLTSVFRPVTSTDLHVGYRRLPSTGGRLTFPKLECVCYSRRSTFIHYAQPPSRGNVQNAVGGPMHRHIRTSCTVSLTVTAVIRSMKLIYSQTPDSARRGRWEIAALFKSTCAHRIAWAVNEGGNPSGVTALYEYFQGSSGVLCTKCTK